MSEMKRKWDEKDLLKYVDDNVITNFSFEPNKAIPKKTGPKPRLVTRDTVCQGDCKGHDCIGKFEKTFRDMVEKTGPYCTICTKKNGNEKRKETCLEDYCVENVANSKEIKEKKEKTCLEKYRNKHAIASTDVRSKIEESFLRYGPNVTNPSQIPGIQSIKQDNSYKKHGVRHPMLVPQISEKTQKSAYTRKEFTMPDGEIRIVQGYEPYALEDLLNEKFQPEDIVTGGSNVPPVPYVDSEGKTRMHTPDIFIKSLNKLIDVKSKHTLEKKKDFVFMKQEAAKKMGYLYEIWVYKETKRPGKDKKGGKGERITVYA
jgi:hypothetical protein